MILLSKKQWVKIIFNECFYKDKIYIQKMSKDNRKALFVEVHQRDIKTNIFKPIHNLFKNESHFFPKRFAILGGYKTGKTELGKFIIDKMKQHYKNLISLVINSQEVQYKGLDEINDWLYEQWYLQLFQIDNPEFKKIVLEHLNEFKETRNRAPEKVLERIYFICESYRKYLKLHSDAKFIVEFDQANVIENEAQFTPFYQFWRNFQGYWENDSYFSELPIFIFVIGHKNWIEFAALKDSVGRGVFDMWVNYNYWSTLDIEEMFKKRLIFGIKPEFQEELLNYFLCSGIIDYFGKKLGKANTAKYLDVFFKDYIMKIIENFQYNRENFKDFLEFCKNQTKATKKAEGKYFVEVERAFHGTPALDYMHVFRFLSDNQNEKWFDELFTLISILYEKRRISFESKEFTKHKNLSYKFITDNFTRDGKKGTKPIYIPPLFLNFDRDLLLNDAFLGCLEAIEGVDRHGSASLLKRFVKSKRLNHSAFVESTDGEMMKTLLDEIKNKADSIFDIVQKWVVNKKKGVIKQGEILNKDILTSLYNLKDDAFNFNNQYEKNSTNWAIFDSIGREIANTVIKETFPADSFIYSILDMHIFNDLNENMMDERTSNIRMAKSVNELLKAYYSQLELYDTSPEELKKRSLKYTTKTIEKEELARANVSVYIDGPNSLGEDYEDSLDLKKLASFAHELDVNTKLYYFTKLREIRIDKEDISKMGYKIIQSYKDIDYLVMDQIKENLDSKKPPNIIILGTKDQDYTDFIKNIRKEYDVRVILAIPSVLGLSKSLRAAFKKVDVKFFSEKDLKVDVYEFVKGREGKIVSWNNEGKACLPDKYGEIQPKIGEKWICEISVEKQTFIILKLIRPFK